MAEPVEFYCLKKDRLVEPNRVKIMAIVYRSVKHE
jgi:hypothetical protein